MVVWHLDCSLYTCIIFHTYPSEFVSSLYPPTVDLSSTSLAMPPPEKITLFLIIGLYLGPPYPPTHPYPSIPLTKASTENEVGWLGIFEIFYALTHTQMQFDKIAQRCSNLQQRTLFYKEKRSTTHI